MNKNELSAQIEPLLDTRAFFYDFLRIGFLQEPTPEFLVFLKDSGLMASFPFQEEQKDIAEGVKLIVEMMGKDDLASPVVYDALHWDYTRMFIGPDRLPAPLWESAYLSKERLLFQERTLLVRQKYLKYKFLPKQFGKEADDHLGLELDFMYRLTLQAQEAIMAGKVEKLGQIFLDQKDFLEQHLLQWVPELAANIEKSANYDFYPGLAKILKGYLSLDLEALKELLDITQSCVN